MGERFDLAPEELRAHVQHLGGVGDLLGQALGQAQGLGTPPDAFGVLFTSIPADIQPLVDEALEVIKSAVESLDVTAQSVTDTVNDYEDTDDANAGYLT